LNFCKLLGGIMHRSGIIFPFPHLRTLTQLPVTKPYGFMTQTFHSTHYMQDWTNCTVHFSRLMTLMHSWLIRVSLVAG
jgi:hypothetical protein